MHTADACKQYANAFFSLDIHSNKYLCIYESDPISFKIYTRTYQPIHCMGMTIIDGRRDCRVDNSNYFDYLPEYYLV